MCPVSLQISYMKPFKHLITSGCSFSHWVVSEETWPSRLGSELKIPVTNYGCASAGNSWIAKSAIYGTQLLINTGTNPEDILVVVMWSGLDRKDAFISKETPRFDRLISNSSVNPANFACRDEKVNHWNTSVDSGYLLGSMSCGFDNRNINAFKSALIRDYYCDEALAIESYENFLRLQWYCDSHRVSLINVTFMDILHYPTYSYQDPGCQRQVLTKDAYSMNVGPLYSMIDLDRWLLWNGTGGSYEYTRDNGLTFNDGMHPSPVAHAHYVINFLIPRINKL